MKGKQTQNEFPFFLGMNTFPLHLYGLRLVLGPFFLLEFGEGTGNGEEKVESWHAANNRSPDLKPVSLPRTRLIIWVYSFIIFHLFWNESRTTSRLSWAFLIALPPRQCSSIPPAWGIIRHSLAWQAIIPPTSSRVSPQFDLPKNLQRVETRRNPNHLSWLFFLIPRSGNFTPSSY